MASKKSLNVIGIMNGTSLDGVDFVLCRVSLGLRAKAGIRFVAHAHSAFPSVLQQKLTLAARHELNVKELALVHHELGRFYAKELTQHKARMGWKFQLIGVHGQTVFHQPPQATLQIGESSYLRTQLKVPVVSDFRVADLAVGGQAAPLAPLFHQVAFRDLAKTHSVAIQNLGGIANVTYLPKGGRGRGLMAFDTGPANMLIDLAVSKFSSGKKRYDDKGKWAQQGLPHPTLLREWMKHPYFAKKPPKSCGREEFGEVFFSKAIQDFSTHRIPKAEDQICHLTEFTAESVVDAYRRLLPDVPKLVLLCGGGAQNLFLKQRLQYLLPDSSVATTDDYGWPSSAIEGAAFALMAAYRYWEIPSDTRPFTGAKQPVLLGKL